jgi:hypothetical protein
MRKDIRSCAGAAAPFFDCVESAGIYTELYTVYTHFTYCMVVTS